MAMLYHWPSHFHPSLLSELPSHHPPPQLNKLPDIGDIPKLETEVLQLSLGYVLVNFILLSNLQNMIFC